VYDGRRTCCRGTGGGLKGFVVEGKVDRKKQIISVTETQGPFKPLYFLEALSSVLPGKPVSFSPNISPASTEAASPGEVLFLGSFSTL
jgi:hypothetical protein